MKLGRLVYGASNSDLEAILGNEGCNCSKIVFDNSFWQPQVTAGILRDESLMILKDYFDKDYLMNPGGTLGLDLDEDKKKYLKEGITR